MSTHQQSLLCHLKCFEADHGCNLMLTLAVTLVVSHEAPQIMDTAMYGMAQHCWCRQHSRKPQGSLLWGIAGS